MTHDRNTSSKYLLITLGLSFLLTLSFDNVLAGNFDDGGDRTSSPEQSLSDQWQAHYDNARSLYASDIDQAIAAANHAREIAMELKDVELIGRSHWMAGWLYVLKSDLVNSFNYYLGARKAFLRLEDWDKVEQIEENLGSIAMDNRSYSTAIKRWEDRLETAQKLDERRVASAHFDLGLAYKQDGQFTQALSHFTHARTLYKLYYKSKDSTELARVFNEIGILYESAFTEKSDWVDSAMINYHRALVMDRSLTMQSMVANNRGNVYREEKQYRKAINQYMKAMAMDIKTGNDRLLMSHLTNAGHAYYLMNKPDSSLMYLTRAIDLEYGGINNNHSDLSQMLEIDMSDYLIQAVQLVDSLQMKYPQYVSNVNYLTILETVSKIKMNMALLESRDNADLIELASKEMEIEMREELFWSDVKFWSSLLFGLIAASLLTHKLIRWYQLKRAAQSEYDRSKRDTKELISEL